MAETVRLKQFRQKKKLTQAAAAESIGIDQRQSVDQRRAGGHSRQGRAMLAGVGESTKDGKTAQGTLYASGNRFPWASSFAMET